MGDVEDYFGRTPNGKDVLPDLFVTPYGKKNIQFDMSTDQQKKSMIFQDSQPCKTQQLFQPNLEKSEKRLRKGLRKLSKLVLKQVSKLKSATYKQVADQLLKELQTPKTQSHRNKHESNIKRRVYDALNVLQAVSAISREGKYVNFTSYQSLAGSKQKINKNLTFLRQAVEDKKLMVQSLFKLHDQLQIMQTRNKKTPQKGLQMPLMLLRVEGGRVCCQSNGLKASSTSRLQVYGESQILKLVMTDQ